MIFCAQEVHILEHIFFQRNLKARECSKKYDLLDLRNLLLVERLTS